MKNVLTFVLLLLIMKGVFGEFVSVMDGDSVTLHTGVAEVQNFKVIDWRFGDVRVAQINRAANIFQTYDNELGGKFKGRLKLDVQTGDLNISDISSTDTGSFKVTITSNIKTIKTFSLTVEQAVAVGPMSVMEKDSVTLHTDVTKIERYDKVQWRFHNSLVAEINRHTGIFKTHDGPDGTFTGRLQLECLTGSLTITNTRKTDFGSYEVALSSNISNYIIHRTFTLTVSGELKSVSVNEGGRVTLNSTLTKIQIYDFIQWMFGDTVIAEINQTVKQSNGLDKRFKDRLKVNNQTGSLTITEIRKTDSGLYKLQVSNGRSTVLRRITVTVTVTVTVDTGLSPGAVTGIAVLLAVVAATAAALTVFFYHRPKIFELERQKNVDVPAMERDSVTLEPDTEIQRDDDIQWMFGDKDCLIAEIKGNTRETNRYYEPDERFKGILELDNRTGSLTIKNIRTEHAGDYKLKIRGRSHKIFSVKVIGEKVISKTWETSLTLSTGIEINKDVRILWLFEDTNSLIADIRGETREITTYDEGRFRDRLKLDEETGDLTITNITTDHAGLYKLKINSGKGSTCRKFKVFVTENVILFKKGESVIVKTNAEIQEDDHILWTFEKSLIAQIKEGIPTYKEEGLELDKKTGSLTITNTTAEHAGLYEVLIISSKGTTYRKFKVVLRAELVPMTEGHSATLNTGLREIQENVQILWMFRDHDFPIAEIKGGTGQTPTYNDGPHGRFKDKLKLDKTTGDLTITNFAKENSGFYKLLTSSGNRATSKRFLVLIRRNESAKVDVPLLDEEDPDGVNEQDGISSL